MHCNLKAARYRASLSRLFEQWRGNRVGRVGKVQVSPECSPPSSRHCIVTCTFKSNHNSQLFILYGRFVHAGECNRFADFGLWIAQKCAWRPGSALTSWGAIIALPRAPSRYKGLGGERRGEEKSWGDRTEGRKGRTWRGRERMEREERDGKTEGMTGRGRKGRKRGGSAWLGYLSRGPEFIVSPLCLGHLCTAHVHKLLIRGF